MAARLEFDITGNTAGLSKSVTAAIGLLNKLQAAGDKLDLFKNAASGANGLASAVGGVTSQVNNLTGAVRKGSQAWNDRTAANAIDTLNTKLNVVRGNADLFGNSIKNNQQTIQALQGAINSLLSAGISPLDSRIQQLRGRIDDATAALNRQKAASQGGIFSGLGGQITGLIGSYVGLYAAIRAGKAIIDNNAEISDSLADVRRTAGLTQIQVEALFQTLKKIDTRTSLKGLVDIAVIGGQLGIASDQLAGFTKVTDQLNVVLSGEIKGGPEEIAKTLGVLNNVFGISAKNGGDVETAFKQIGSALLGLGQSGLATGDFIADFASKVGGVAAKAKLSIPQLLSYGAVLQENGVTAEVAGTSFSKLILSLASKRGDFLAIAKFADSTLTLQKFTDLINNDTNAALRLFFEGLNKGGKVTTEFADLLETIVGKGARSSQTISAIADHLQALAKHQSETNDQFKQGIIVDDQFKIKNDTLGSSVDKLSKSFVSLTTSGNVSTFFKGIIDGLSQTINAVDGLVNSKSWDEFRAGFTNIAHGVVKFETAGLVDLGTAKAPQQFDSRKNNVNRQVKAFNNLPDKEAQRQAIFTQTARRDLAAQIAEGTGATRKNITALNDEQKILNILRQTYHDLYETQKSSSTEVADSDLKTTKSIRKRIQELQNDALANPSKKDADALRIQALTARLRELSGAAAKAGTALGGISLSKQLADILNTGDNSSAKSGLSGIALDVQKINNQYDDLNRKLDEFDTKVKASNIPTSKKNSLLAQSATGRDTGEEQRQLEINNARLKSVQDTANNIQRINDEFGVKAAQSRDKELLQVQQLADAENAKYAAGSQERIAIEQGKVVAIAAINEKYAQQALDIQSKIDALNEAATAQLGGSEDKKTQKIKSEWDKRLADANKYFTELRKLQNGTTQGAINDASLFVGISGPSTIASQTGQATVTKNITKGSAAAQADAGISDLGKLFNKTFDQSIRQLGSSFSNTFQTIGQDGNRSITDIFSNLQKNLSTSLTSTFIKFGTDYLGDALKKGITGGTGNLSDIFKNGISSGVGAGLIAAGVGSLVSSLTPKTSVAGQTIGGALTGAGTGALTGTAIAGPLGTVPGAIIGGVAGAVGGLFGAKSARKKEKQLQEQQLEEAKKQTALLRQQQQAYSASIIGKMTDSGTITAVNIDALGKLTATISGKDIQLALDRTAASR